MPGTHIYSFWSSLFLIMLLGILSSCQGNAQTSSPNEKGISLKTHYEPHFYIGAALNEGAILEADKGINRLVSHEFSAITPENVMKWMHIHPSPDQYDFTLPDAYVAFGEARGMHVVGHTLVWHSQLAPWVEEIRDSTALMYHVEQHIKKVAGRYNGKVHTWDVLNEALNEDGSCGSPFS